jgi:DNA-binding MarR family transcriptional regulator
MNTPAGPGPEDDRARQLGELITAVRRYRDAERLMRGRSRTSMQMGRTDLTALRLMLRAGNAGRPLSAAVLARELQISTAATTVLVDRLERSGHAERHRSTTDARSIEIRPTAASHEDVRATMGELHERMMAIAGALLPDEARVITRFLGDLGAAVERLDLPQVPARPL